MAIKATGQLTLYDQNDAIIATDAPANPSIGTLWLDTSVTPNVIYRWDGVQWAKTTPTTAGEIGTYTTTEIDEGLNGRVSTTTYATDQEGVTSRLSTNESAITQHASKISLVVSEDNAIKADEIASSIALTPTAIEIISDNIDITGKVTFSSMDSTTQAKITAGENANSTVSNWRYGTGTTIDGGMIETDTITANHISSLNGLNVGNGQFVVDSYGNVTFGGDLNGATGTFSGNINTESDVYVGQNIYLEYEYEKRFDDKGIVFYDGIGHGDSGSYDTRITGTYLGMDIVSVQGIDLVSTRGSIDFDTNTIRVNRGEIWINSTQPIQSVSETGVCGVGGCSPFSWTGSSVAGVFVNFRIRKSYTPSTASLQSSLVGSGYNVSPNVTDISTDGFWLYVNSNGNMDTYHYWRGSYTA